MYKILTRVTFPISGLMLGLASAGNLFQNNYIGNVMGILSFAILILLIMKVFLQTEIVRNNIKNSDIASSLPTFSMGVMTLSTYFSEVNQSLAKVIWIIALLIHIIIILYFTKEFIFNFKLSELLPSYFVVYVGIVVGSVTSKVFGFEQVGRLLFYFGFACYWMLLPIILYKVFILKNISKSSQPTLAILTAPPSLCLAGYIQSFSEHNAIIINLLFLVSQTMFLIVMFHLPKLLKLKFYPSDSAFTFPLVITAVSISMVNNWLIKSFNSIKFLNIIVITERIIAISIVLFILYRYTKFLFFEKN
jgi:exfoliative toxin A/B